MYVVVNEEANKAQILTDSTQVALIIGVSTRTIQRWMTKTYYKKGFWSIYRVDEGVQRSKRGNKPGNVIPNDRKHDIF